MFSILIIALCTQPTTCLPQPLLGIDRGVDGAASAVERREFAPLPQSAAGQRENRTAWAPQSWAWGKHGDERGICSRIGHQCISYSFSLFHFAITSDTSASSFTMQERQFNQVRSVSPAISSPMHHGAPYPHTAPISMSQSPIPSSVPSSPKHQLVVGSPVLAGHWLRLNEASVSAVPVELWIGRAILIAAFWVR